MWIICCFAAVAGVLLFIKLRKKSRSEGYYEYTDTNSGERQAQMNIDAAYEHAEAENRNAQEIAEQNTSLWL